MAVPFVMFAAREVPTESLGFSPNELVFGHRVRGPLDVIKDEWCKESTSQSLLEFVIKTRERMHWALQLAKENLAAAQKGMKRRYDQKAVVRKFQVGDKVLVLLPVQGRPLAARYSGPYQVDKVVGELDYLVATPDRRKTHQLCHINMLKPYYSDQDPEEVVSGGVDEASSSLVDTGEEERGLLVLAVGAQYPEEVLADELIPAGSWMGNSKEALKGKLGHLPEDRQQQMLGKLWQCPEVFSDSPGRTTWIEHDIDVQDHPPIKLPPYRVNPRLQSSLEEEIQYMVEKGLVRRAYSEWSSPVTLQPKSDGKLRFCGDFRKLNSITRIDSSRPFRG